MPVSGLGRAYQGLNVHASVPANSVADVIAMAKAQPGAINYGSIGIGSSIHLNSCTARPDRALVLSRTDASIHTVDAILLLTRAAWASTA